MKIKATTLAGLMAALMCLMGPLTVPVGTVLLSLTTFGVYLSARVLDSRLAGVSTGLYVLLGLVGLPVFSGFSGGIGSLMGPTGGYVLGYGLLAVISGSARIKNPYVAMGMGTLLMYALGGIRLAHCLQWDGVQAFLAGIVPFLPGNGIKMVMAQMVAWRIQRALNHR